MIECGSCNDWFHFDCVNLDEDEAERIHTYICPDCETSTGQKTSHTFDIATFPSPSPPPGVERSPAKRKTPAKAKNAKPTFASSPAPSASSSHSSSDDDASDAAVDSASSDDDRPAPSDGSFKRPAPKRARISSSALKATAPDKKPQVKRASTGFGLLPARLHVQKKLSEVVKGLFGDAMSGEEADRYAAVIEEGVWAAFKDVVGGKDAAGGRYKTQFNLLHSSLPKARSDLRDSIISRSLSPAQIATLTPSDLASTERLEEIKRAQQAVLEQTVKAKEDVSGIRFVRDGFEKVEDSREKELASLQRQEEAARRESIVAASTPEKPDVPDTPTREALLKSPSASVSVQMHDEHDNTAADVLSSFAPVPQRTPSIDIPPSPTTRQSFSLTSAWTAPTKLDMDELDFGAGDQSALDLSDIIVEQEPEEIEPEEEEKQPSEMDLFLAQPIVWSGGINNPADASPITPKMDARLISARSVQPPWSLLLPHPTVDITGRVPIKSSLKFLSESRLSPAKELITVAFSLDGDASAEQRARWEHLVEFHLSRDRHALYLPYGQNSASVPPGAAKELYLVPMRPSDPSPEFTDLIDGYSLPAERTESILLGVFIANREIAPIPTVQSPVANVPPPPPPPLQQQQQPQPQPMLPNEKLQALMASLNPAALQSALAGSASPVTQGGTTPLAQPPIVYPAQAYPPSGYTPQPPYPPYPPSVSHPYADAPAGYAPPQHYRQDSYEARGARYDNEPPMRRRNDRERSPERRGGGGGGGRGRDFNKQRDSGWGSRGRGR
ncbi:hypothetical protein BCR39DRAFT_588270 [Naematelia encephala]|uniref:Transcription factor BYE1 n=1 Tax=Naematelia encephala TaxID=71784 RepID=A0A1Y2B6G2_9TREE|nr:hypothetical protein BCR39DRAFT_588270 [Naematelia encephala]